ncbi:hypothetical protein SAMN04488020_106232 [Palleronia marisminoris]|uniref:Uncharacterized protein n=2 Tax=Palleronia marisminoris TaxID=315423 RepID=A0A1Y5SZZ9_9RHOB|nr:hypothetical protein [Palleronia marisminoris]SFH09698.1 hypothetical protein SAMN04488020_106232 [Palleronia marisminoris]SLN52617.1 hypothetical protein PAM7066_02467 [Palleronia marisminoris]
MSMNEDDLTRALGALKEPASDDLMSRVLADAALEQGRRAPPQPSDLLLARVLRDARRAAAGRRRRDSWAWGGIAAACAVGIFLGIADPGGVVASVAPESYAMEDLSGVYAFQLAEVVE